ncbi:MAG TPA: hypothetical protein VGL81_12355 [Polyangiaceae bacterium]|jgi:hypothetical protein
MRRAVLLLAFAGASVPAVALADDVPGDFGRIVFETGRVPEALPEPGLLRLQIHGEEQIRYEHLRSFPLDVSATRANAFPGATSDSLGQNDFVSHWFRITPTLQLGTKLRVVGQGDLTGMLLGDLAHDTSADQTPRDQNNGYDGFSNLQPRWLYLEWTSPVGLLRVGQQPSHWGMGLVANDGDHPSLFGDYRYGNIVEQVLFATKPLGIESPFVVALAGNLVYRDNVAILTNGDHAFQGILAAFYQRGADMLGVYGVYRDQNHSESSEPTYFNYTDSIHVGVLDVAGSFARPLTAAGETAYLFGSFEAATELGSTDEERTIYQLPGPAGGPATEQWTKIRTYGGAASLGVVLAGHEGLKPARDAATRPDLYGRIVAQVEVGYASGDANPDDTTEKRFVFDPNHKVGLVLFDEVMRWQTARAATAAQDPNLANGSRPTPGASLLPSNGGVFGTQYVYPTAVYRPRPWLDLKGGAVIAQTTADYVDPYRLVPQGAYVNYTGGDPKRHDLGLELDGGFEARLPLGPILRLQLGAQAGVLFPGGALADATGMTMKTPWIAVGRMGLQY